jgi:hypothetical protein
MNKVQHYRIKISHLESICIHIYLGMHTRKMIWQARLTPVILTNWETEIRSFAVRSQPRQIVL